MAGQVQEPGWEGEGEGREGEGGFGGQVVGAA